MSWIDRLCMSYLKSDLARSSIVSILRGYAGTVENAIKFPE